MATGHGSQVPGDGPTSHLPAAEEPLEALSVDEAFHLATMGSAEVMGLGHKIGNFEVGKQFDALVVDVEAKGAPIDVWPCDGTAERFSKWVFCGDDRNVAPVFVAGSRVV